MTILRAKWVASENVVRYFEGIDFIDPNNLKTQLILFPDTMCVKDVIVQ
jgi:hypothetical protein